MKILIFIQYIATYHFFYSSIIFLVLETNGIYGKSNSKTKHLLQNIRTHLAQKADEIVKRKECESGLILCKSEKDKEADDREDKSEEIPPPPNLVRGQHKPVIKINPKDVTQTLIPKAQKSLFRKSPKFEQNQKHQKLFPFSETNDKDEDTTFPENKVSKIDKPNLEPRKTFTKLLKEEEKLSKTLGAKVLEVTKEKTNKDSREHQQKFRFAKIEKSKPDKLIKRDVKSEKQKISEPRNISAEGGFLSPVELPIFLLTPSKIQSLCDKHSLIFLKQLKKFKIWALMMFDATAKLPSGTLQGNINHLGDFDECLSINAVFKNSKKNEQPSGIRGKYCLANIDLSSSSEDKNLHKILDRIESFQFVKSTVHDPGHFIPRFSTINWGLCVPSTCSAEDVEKFVKSRLEILTNTTGILFDIKVDEKNCIVKDDLIFQNRTGTMVTILFYGLVLIISLYATFIDSKENAELNSQTKSDRKAETENLSFQEDTQCKEIYSLKGKTRDIIKAFSLKRNMKKLFYENNKGVIECIHGIKSLFTIMLYLAHKTIPLGMTPYSNRVLLTKISNNPATMLLRTSIIYTDSFLLMSGVLTSYNIVKEHAESKRPSWIKKAISRYIRLTPPLLAVLLFYAYVWDEIGSGPLWNSVVRENASLCRKYMWRNLLYIQNFFPFENMCAPQTHQLALDMQLSFFVPLFVNLINKYDKTGVGILQALFIMSSILRYTSSANNELSVVVYHGMSVSQLYKTANFLYAQTLHRASPYVMGVIVGYYIKKFENQFEIPKAFAALCWILSFTFGFYCVVSPSHLALRTYEYNVQEASQYAALLPVAWSFSLSWLIIACHFGYGGILNDFLCQKIFLIFSKISYSVYLVQFLIFFYKIGVKRIPEMFTFTGSVNISEFFFVIAVSITVTILFDFPMIEIKRIIFDTEKTTIDLSEGETTSEHLLESTDSLQTEYEGKNQTLSDEDLLEETEESVETPESEKEEEETEEETEPAEVEEIFEVQSLKRSTRMSFKKNDKSDTES